MDAPDIIFLQQDFTRIKLKKVWSETRQNYNDIEYIRLKHVDIKNTLTDPYKINRIFRTVITYTCFYFGITEDELKIHSNYFRYAYPRKYAYAIIHKLKSCYMSNIPCSKFAIYLGFTHGTGSTQASKIIKNIQVDKHTEQNFNRLYNSILTELKEQDSLMQQGGEYTPSNPKEQIINPITSRKITGLFQRCPKCYNKSMPMFHKIHKCTVCGWKEPTKKIQSYE